MQGKKVGPLAAAGCAEKRGDRLGDQVKTERKRDSYIKHQSTGATGLEKTCIAVKASSNHRVRGQRTRGQEESELKFLS